MRTSDTERTAWSGYLDIDDTSLAMSDTQGAGQPVVYLNGAYASQRHWRPVIAELGSDWRHITFDERGRGRSRTSSDYSFEGCLRDLDAVLEATGVERPVLAGWSFGAFVAVHWAARNPGRARGLVLADGGYPYNWLDDAGRERVRRMFRRMGWLFPLASRFGLAGRMSAEEHANINIELNEIAGAMDHYYDRLTCPARFVVASGGNLGGSAEEQARMRATLDPVLARNPNVQVSAKVPSNHSQILKKDYRAVAAAIREAAAEE